MTAAALLLAGCSTTAEVKPQVLTPPPSSPRTEFFVERAEVQSREVGEAAWERNAVYGQFLADALRGALAARGKIVGNPPADVVRAQIYLAAGAAPVTVKDRRKQKAHVEIRLQLLDRLTGRVIYSTHTVAPLGGSTLDRLGLGDDPDAEIRDALGLAARDFASRL